MSSPKKRRAEIRAMFGGKCAYCGYDLPEKGWHEDHVEPIYRVTAKAVQSWRWIAAAQTCRFPERGKYRFPSCAPCNQLKGALSIEDFRRVVSELFFHLLDGYCASSQRKHFGDWGHAKRYGLNIIEVKADRAGNLKVVTTKSL
jgi:hypothetical protein